MCTFPKSFSIFGKVNNLIDSISYDDKDYAMTFSLFLYIYVCVCVYIYIYIYIYI